MTNREWDDGEGRALFGAHWTEHQLTPDCDCGGDDGADDFLAALEVRADEEPAA